MKKKGFTLVELLAVIIILAVIALIGTPIVSNLIDESKKNSAVNSGYGYIKAVQNTLQDAAMDNLAIDLTEGTFDGTTFTYYQIGRDGSKTRKTADINVKVSGNTPTSVNLVISDGIVTGGNLSIAGFGLYVEANGKVGLGGSAITYEVADASETYLGILYLDPTNLSKTCTKEEAESNLNSNGTPTNIKSGCMKWFIYKDNGNGTVQAILDHNTTNRVTYNSTGSNSSLGTGNYEITKILEKDTSGWATSLNARLPHASEIAIAGEASEWHETSGTQSFFGGSISKRSNYAWLYNYLYDSAANGGTISDNYSYSWYGDDGNLNSATVYGYWTDTPRTGATATAFAVRSDGYIDTTAVSSPNRGVRPVITVSNYQISGKEHDSVASLTYVAPTVGETHRGIVYMDPTDLSRTCTASDVASNLQGKDKNGATTLTETKTGCMKWYIYGENSANYFLILDHNTTARSVYDFDNVNNGTVDQYSARWELDQLVTTSRWKVTPRFITADEVATISENSSFNAATTNSDGWFYIGDNNQTATVKRQPYAWLFDNTYRTTYGTSETHEYLHLDRDGNKISRDDATYGDRTFGYWTDTKIAESDSYVWRMYRAGYLRNSDANNAGHGVRPVVTIAKNQVIRDGQKVTYVAASSSDTHKGVLYLDPTNPNRVCTAANVASNVNGNGTPTNIKTGCMKWFIYKDNGNGTVQAILDHNTTAVAMYDFDNKNSYANGKDDSIYEAKWSLEQDISNWASSLNARIPHAAEIAEAGGISETTASFFGVTSTTDTSNRGSYWWLYTNSYNVTSNNGQGNDSNTYTYYSNASGDTATAGTYGYWTDTPKPDVTDYEFYVDYRGVLNYTKATDHFRGVRPVITVPTNLYK